MNPFLGITFVLVALGALLPGVKSLQSRGLVAGETARKFVHIGMGTICLTFPGVFQTAWPVWVLAALAVVTLGSLRTVPWLRREIGGVLHTVNRSSWGELYFPVGVAGVFALSRGKSLPFIIAVSLLTFADAAGALVGVRWGQHKFATLEGEKSVEGSLAVGLTGFACGAIPLLVTRHAVVDTVLISAAIGLFALILEAISWNGLDNIFLPLAAFAQISVYLETPTALLALKLSVLIGLTAIALVWRRGQIVDDSARLGAALALYFFWSVGGWPWLVAPLILLVSYVRLMPTGSSGRPRHNLVAVICVSSVGLVWCVAQAFTPRVEWLGLFTMGIATHQAVIGIVRFSQAKPYWPRFAWWTLGVGQAAITQVLAYSFLSNDPEMDARKLLAGLSCVALAAAVFVLTERQLQLPAEINRRWWKQGAIAVLASTTGLLISHL